MNRWQEKAAAYSAGWRDVFGVNPTTANTVLGLAVAEHETRCGDSWPGEHNWGAVQGEAIPGRGLLTVEEKAAVAHLKPHPSTVEEARRALEAAGHRWRGLHVDSNPGEGFYWVFFRVFDTEAEGARHFVVTIAGRRSSCRMVLERTGTARELAEAMYRSGYYTGFYKRTKPYERQANGKWLQVAAPTETSVLGGELNIRAYSDAIARHAPAIARGLAPATSRPTIRRGDRGPDVQAWQRIVGVVADGIFGIVTQAATMLWQRNRGLVADGIVGPRTWATAGE